MHKDGHIRLLPLHIANKIAAGEVVERPASVVKELLENAIDAGATRVDVTVTAGGRKLIEIRDNGCGMTRDDALLCIERQATSKIRDVDDIARIDTLGFRGEAIPSIASISRFSLKTRREGEEAGTEIVISGGGLQEVRDAGTPVGTVISVRDLFFNVPARRKFLRAYQTEQAHIKSVFTLHALANPKIAMSLTADGRPAAVLPGGATLDERVRDLFGADFLAEMKPVGHRAGAIAVTGFAGLPTQTRGDRSEQYIFINRRPATSPVIAYALKESYPPLEAGRKPIVLLFIEMPPDNVDVNVHPTKREVRFTRPAEVRDALIAALTRALGTKRRHPRSFPGFPPPPAAGVSFPPPAPFAPPAFPGGGAGPAALRTLVPRAGGAAHPLPFPYPAEPPQPPGPRPPDGTDAPGPAPGAGPAPGPGIPAAQPPPTDPGAPLFTTEEPSSPWRWSRVVGQVADRYILLETDGGYVTVDPQAARERVLYERLMDGAGGAGAFSQKLLIPETVRLPPEDARSLRKHLAAVQDMGFGVEEFGGDHFLVESLPTVLDGASCRELLADIARDLESAGVRRGAAKWREEVIAKAACRAAAGAKTRMDNETAQKLVDELAAARMPYTCPRGRPTMIFTSYRELERKFGRS